MPIADSIVDIVAKIMIEVLSVLALATKQIKQGRFSKYTRACHTFLPQYFLGKFAKKLLGESDIEAVLQRLDRLTQEEARMTVAQTLQVVYGLVNNVKMVIDSAPRLISQFYISY
jgi:hypothetical protein